MPLCGHLSPPVSYTCAYSGLMHIKSRCMTATYLSLSAVNEMEREVTVASRQLELITDRWSCVLNLKTRRLLSVADVSTLNIYRNRNGISR